MESYATWRRSTSGGIKFKLKDGPSFDYADDHILKASETIIIRSQDLDAFLQEMLPYPTTTSGIGMIMTPAKMAGTSSLYVKDISAVPMDLGKPADPLGTDLGAPVGTYADYYEVTLNFSHTSQESDTFLEREITYSMEMAEIGPAKTEESVGSGSEDANTIFTAGNPTTPTKDKSSSIYKAIPMINLSLRYKFVVNPNWPLLFSLCGKVNTTTHTLFLNAEPTTVLFRGFTARQEFLYKDKTTQVNPWSFDLQFSIKRIVVGTKVYGWCHQWSPNKKRWVWKLINGSPPFEFANLASLFT